MERNNSNRPKGNKVIFRKKKNPSKETSFSYVISSPQILLKKKSLNEEKIFQNRFEDRER